MHRTHLSSFIHRVLVLLSHSCHSRHSRCHSALRSCIFSTHYVVVFRIPFSGFHIFIKYFLFGFFLCLFLTSRVHAYCILHTHSFECNFPNESVTCTVVQIRSFKLTMRMRYISLVFPSTFVLPNL